MSIMTFSIIIPIFNVEKYISKCLDSIFSQNVDENQFEIIAVDDGTPDNSMNIVERYCSSHNNIHIIHQKNAGVSAARNVGIANSQGDFIIFMDPDDWMLENSFTQIINLIDLNTTVDIIILNSLTSDTKKKNYDWSCRVIPNTKYNGLDLFKRHHYLRGSVCGAIYNRSFILKHNLSFPLKIRNGEDSIFYSICQTYAKEIVFYSIDFYCCFNRPNSASKTIDLSNIHSYLQAMDYCQNIENKMYTDNIDVCIMEYRRYLLISNFTINALKIRLSYRSILDNFNLLKFLPINSRNIPISRKRIKILNFSYYLYYLLMKVFIKTLYR